MRQLLSLGVLAFTFTIISQSATGEELTKEWPQWRGPDASGVAVNSNPPTTWSESENIKWKVKVPGAGSSTPIILGDRIYVSTAVKTDRVAEGKTATEDTPAEAAPTQREPWDHEGESFIVALDAKTGDEKWRQSRDERTTWSTPLITEYEGRMQVITNGSKRVRSYDLATGELIWECGGQTENPIPSPVRFEDNVIVMTGFRGNAIYSIPLNAKGDITDSDKIIWFEQDAAPYVPSPVLYKGQLYFVKSNNGILVSRDAKTGKLLIDETRLPNVSSVYASPVAAANHIYLTGRDGTTLVLDHGTSIEVVATNKLDDEIDASAAIVGNEIFLRGKVHLYCIAQ